MDTKTFIEIAGRTIDVAGVVVIVIGALAATGIYGYRLLHHHPVQDTYHKYRRGLGRAILLGLEFLVAADIIRTVAISPTFTSVGVLAVIVLVRTFLSFSLGVELEGRWPWQQRLRTGSPPGSDTPSYPSR